MTTAKIMEKSGLAAAGKSLNDDTKDIMQGKPNTLIDSLEVIIFSDTACTLKALRENVIDRAKENGTLDIGVRECWSLERVHRRFHYRLLYPGLEISSLVDNLLKKTLYVGICGCVSMTEFLDVWDYKPPCFVFKRSLSVQELVKTVQKSPNFLHSLNF